MEDNLNSRQYPVLLVEDSHEDFAAFQRVVRLLEIENPIYRLEDGDEALDFLFRSGEYSHPTEIPQPALILLDLNLPGTDGRDVIKQVKQAESLRKIPIVVLTTSSNPRDVQACYEYGANAYNVKPMGTEALRQTVGNIFSYWLDSVVLPITA